MLLQPSTVFGPRFADSVACAIRETRTAPDVEVDEPASDDINEVVTELPDTLL